MNYSDEWKKWIREQMTKRWGSKKTMLVAWHLHVIRTIKKEGYLAVYDERKEP